jgi:hypothetical protein
MLDFLKTPIIKTVIRRGVGVAVAALATYLVKQGLATDGEAAKLAADLAEPLAVLVYLVYDYARERAVKKAEQKITVALNLPEGSTKADLHAAMKERG